MDTHKQSLNSSILLPFKFVSWRDSSYLAQSPKSHNKRNNVCTPCLRLMDQVYVERMKD